jgi:hypothetical protein
VYGKRKVYDETEISLKHITKAITPNFGVTYRIEMTGRGAARNLTADPDFLMREANSPPQGTKRSSGNRVTSAEKKNRPAPKETSAPK